MDLINNKKTLKNNKNNNTLIIGLIDIDCFECQVIVNKLQPQLKDLPCASISW